MIEDKITILNETVLECLNETEENKIIELFADVSIKVLEADFGFVWINSQVSRNLELVYKSPNLPFTPNPPRKGGRNYTAMKSFAPNYVTETKTTLDSQYVSQYVKSFVIIPLFYKKTVYGTLVLCFKKPESFNKEKRTLSVFIGNSLAQAITIRRLVVIEKEKIEKEMMFREIETLLEQEKLKSEFIANATHELRTPLSIIKGSVDLAQQLKSIDSKISKKFLKSIDYEVMHLSKIISDLTLLITKGKKFKHTADLIKVSLKPIINTAVRRCKSLADKKSISIKIKEISDVKVLGDKIYLEKMLTNLVRNSIIYGKKKGNVRICLNQSDNLAHIIVEDDGEGISREDLPLIFERFYRADKSYNSSDEGIGLGLSIVKWIAEIHSGEVFVESKPKKGSLFRVSIPIFKEGK